MVHPVHLLSNESNKLIQLVFQMTVRMATCAELSENLQEVEEVQRMYWQLEKCATPTALLLPWFPGPAKRRKKKVTKDLYTKLYDYLERRKNAATPTSDALDVLLAEGLPHTEILEVSRQPKVKDREVNYVCL